MARSPAEPGNEAEPPDGAFPGGSRERGNENLAHRRRSDRAKAQLQTFSSQSLQMARSPAEPGNEEIGI